MLENTRKTVVAFVAVIALIGIVPMPTQAVSASCSSGFVMDDEPPSTSSSLAGESSVTASIVVGTSDDKKVIVELGSLASELQFGVFLEDGSKCVAADTLVTIDCSGHEVLNTDNDVPPVQQECALEKPTSGTYTYYFHLVNPRETSLLYRIWSEDTA